MAFEDLQKDWTTLLGEDGLALATGEKKDNDRLPNHLQKIAEEKGLKGNCRYVLSSDFECCGLAEDDRSNFSSVLLGVMQRSTSAAISAGWIEPDAPILFALSPYRAFGAEVMSFPSGYLVLFNKTTFNFCFLYAILAVTSAQATGLMCQGLVPSDERGSPRIDPFAWAYDSHQSILQAFKEYVATRTIANPIELIDKARYDLLPWHYVERVQATYEQMLDFLALHELGHVSLGHMRGMMTTQRSVPGTSITLTVGTPSPKQEEFADQFALRALIGTNTGSELAVVSNLLEARKFGTPELDKFWMGHTCIGRYTSALQLLKAFDVLDTFLTDRPDGTKYTQACEINGTHPSGMHRFVDAWSMSKSQLDMPAGVAFNLGAILHWNNLMNVSLSASSIEEARALWEEVNSRQEWKS